MTHYNYQCSKDLLVFLFINYNSDRNNIPENEKKKHVINAFVPTQLTDGFY